MEARKLACARRDPKAKASEDEEMEVRDRRMVSRDPTPVGHMLVNEGKVIGQCFPRHRHQEFLRFLRQLDDEFPEELKLHLVLDNYGTHKHPKVRSWLERHPRFTLHFVPTSSSWLNQVERWFGELTQKAVRRGTFISVAELKEAIEQFLQAWNEAPRPFVWTATVEKIMVKIERARQRLEGIKPGWSKRKRRKKRR